MNSEGLSKHDLGMGKKTIGVYSLGIVLCLILTLIPFASVYYDIFTHNIRLLIVILAMILQFFVQVVCFLRLTAKTEQGRINIFSFIFAIFVLFVIVGGSMWIMVNLNYNMMN